MNLRAQATGFPAAQFLVLLGAGASITIAGAQEVWSIIVFLASAGIGLCLIRPVERPALLPSLLILSFCLLCLLAFLPLDCFPVPAWREGMMKVGVIPLADSVSPQPWHGWFWWWLLAATCLIFLAFLAAPLETGPLSTVLHVVALFVAIYAVLAVLDYQTEWRYPFHGGAVFGFLPNRNHSATLLVVGSVISFGLMQWRLARGDKSAAALAALCGAPSLAALLFFSTSRAGVVFLAVGLALWAAGAARSQAMRRRFLAAASVLVVFLGMLFVLGGSTVRDRLGELWQKAFSVQSEGEVRDVDFRQPIFRDTSRMIADVPLTGAGLGQFADVFPQYRRDSVREAAVLHPESDWLMVAAETGIPSVAVLALLAGWYLARSWKARSAAGGMLRWTAASAVFAAVLHGLIDVPWHRPSLGWFLLVIAASAAPSSGRPLRFPRLGRSCLVVAGLVIVGWAVFLGRDKWNGQSPLFYRWPEIAAQLQRLGEEQRFDQGEKAAQDAVRQFPLNYNAYYWLAALMRALPGPDEEVYTTLDAGRRVEPVLARVPAEQAVILHPVSASAAVDAWSIAVDRAARVDAAEKRAGFPTAAEYVRRASAAFPGDSNRQLQLAERLRGQPEFLAVWFSQADAQAAESFLNSLGGVEAFLDGLPTDARSRILERWAYLPSGQKAVAYMEARSFPAPGPYWRQLSNVYAKAGDKQRASLVVAQAEGISLGERLVGGEFGGQLAELQRQGNPVAVRRLLKEVAEGPRADPEKLRVAMTWYAAEGDWEMAWKAASRLATLSKKGQ